MTWFSSPVWAQGLRRDKEYARLGDNLRHCSWKWTTSWYAWYQWLPAAWEDLNEALPKCRNWKKCAWLPYTYLWNLSLPHLNCSSFDPFLSRKQLRGVHQFRWFADDCKGHGHRATCFTDRNGHQKQNCESLKRMWRNFAHLTRPPYQSNAWRPTGMHCWKVTRHKRITCIFFLDVVRTLVFLRTYKSAQMVEVLLMNRFPRSIVSDSKGLTAGKWVLSRGSLHSSSYCGISFLSLRSVPAQCNHEKKELWCRLLSPVKSWLWKWSKMLRCVNF